MVTIWNVFRNRYNNNKQIMNKYQILVPVYFLFSGGLFASEKISRTEYVENWKDVAISEMIEHKVPASITLAQGILESGYGNSFLATSGKNHFGIKCHGWEGDEIYLDDDKESECFRVYETADQSFKDHSDFLLKYDRYSSLFDLDITDYKGWAKGLKKSGYATNPKYPDLLIKLIEDLNLSKYDLAGNVPESVIAENVSNGQVELNIQNEVSSNSHKTYVHDKKVKYVIAKNGDTFYRISKEFGLSLNQLYRYNSYDGEKDVLLVGDRVYIQPKRKASVFKKEDIKIEQDMTVAEMSQEYAVTEKAIVRLNSFSSDDTVRKGEVVTLR
jgi:LysM repeat protein